MFGHALRMGENTPARKAMNYFFQVPQASKFKGRKRATIVSTLNRDIERTRAQSEEFVVPLLKSELDLQNIRAKALDRNHWQKIVKMVTNAAYSDIALQCRASFSHWSMAQQELKRCVALCFLLRIQLFPIKSETFNTRDFLLSDFARQ